MKVLFLGTEKTSVYQWLKHFDYELLFTSTAISIEKVIQIEPDFIVSHGYRHIIGPDIVAEYFGKIINLHISYLPWNKGADPNFWSFYDNTPKGVTIHLVDDKLDTGDILVQCELDFNLQKETLASSYAILQKSILNLFIQSWQDIVTGKLIAKPQMGAGTYHNTSDKNEIFEKHNISWDTRLCDIVLLKKQLEQK